MPCPPRRPILKISDICDLLRISQSQYYALKETLADLGLLNEIMPRLDHSPRYSGEPFVKWLSDRKQQALWRQELERLGG